MEVVQNKTYASTSETHYSQINKLFLPVDRRIIFPY